MRPGLTCPGWNNASSSAEGLAVVQTRIGARPAFVKTSINGRGLIYCRVWWTAFGCHLIEEHGGSAGLLR
jgi:hypothetical protein